MINIFKTFELFLREPLSLFRNGLVQIVNIQDNIFAKKSAINVDLMRNKAQITVVNNDKVYNLLKLVTYRAQRRKNKSLASSAKLNSIVAYKASTKTDSKELLVR